MKTKISLIDSDKILPTGKIFMKQEVLFPHLKEKTHLMSKTVLKLEINHVKDEFLGLLQVEEDLKILHTDFYLDGYTTYTVCG